MSWKFHCYFPNSQIPPSSTVALSLPAEHGWMWARWTRRSPRAPLFQRCRDRPLRVSHFSFATLFQEAYEALWSHILISSEVSHMFLKLIFLVMTKSKRYKILDTFIPKCAFGLFKENIGSEKRFFTSSSLRVQLSIYECGTFSWKFLKLYRSGNTGVVFFCPWIYLFAVLHYIHAWRILCKSKLHHWWRNERHWKARCQKNNLFIALNHHINMLQHLKIVRLCEVQNLVNNRVRTLNKPFFLRTTLLLTIQVRKKFWLNGNTVVMHAMYAVIEEFMWFAAFATRLR